MNLSHGLFSEFDEFTVQTKSALDHLIKIMVPNPGIPSLLLPEPLPRLFS
jgi:hypothetical protein